MTASDSQIVLALCGAGAIAACHMQALTQLGGVVPRWVVSRTEDEALEFGRRWHFDKVSDSLSPALADPAVQLVLIASPSALHASQAIAALKAGKDVVVEIPVGLSWGEVEAVAQAAVSTQRRVWVCHTLRSLPALREVRRRVREGQLHITQINGFFGIPRRRNQGMGNIGVRGWIDNLLWHHGCHQVDAALWTLDMPAVTRVQALLGKAHPTFGMALDAGVQLMTMRGELITQALSYNVEQPTWRLDFIGHDDVLTCDGGRLTNEAGEELTPFARTTDLLVQDGEILHAKRSGESSEFDLSGILPTMRVLARAESSADEDAR